MTAKGKSGILPDVLMINKNPEGFRPSRNDITLMSLSFLFSHLNPRILGPF